MVASKAYTVTVTAKTTVAAALPMQEHRRPLSNLDLLLPPLDVGIFLCYENAVATSTTYATMVAALKASLARTLATYYPFAGEVVSNEAGEPELLCSNRGVDFVEARADAELRELCFHDPDESVEGKLVPKKKKGVLCVQATELKCGGVVVACTFDHRVADAYSTNMFIVSWAETVRSAPLSVLPTFRSSLLAPRPAAAVDASIDRLYAPLSSLPPPPDSDTAAAPVSVNRIYYIAAKDVTTLQAAAGKGKTKLEAFTACLWRLLAKAADADEKVCCMGVVVNGRGRLCGGEDDMLGYFGNVLSIPYGTLDVEALHGMKLDEVAEHVHGWVSAAATEKHFLNLVDWVESRRPVPSVARIYCGEEGGPACVVSSGRGFPEEADFGWGRPAFGSYHFPWGDGAGYVMPIPRGSGDWVVYAHLARRFVAALEEEPTVFRPLTTDYILNKIDSEN
ncbi:Rosmarinate synthase [Ananas comosus]|uniref:Rosmarinate synthase n=1 Tax=Ananas comosus TaxID=4615 RepID=A0A199UQ17_ANACO|nr:Rosmarinate synthase [Ananas comosus]